MKLYVFPPSPNTRKVLAVVHHLGLTPELVFVDLGKGEQMKPDFIAVNPNHMTPALEDNGFLLWESNAIMQYLCSQKTNTLWPQDPKTQADVARWLYWQSAHWDYACNPFTFERVVKQFMKLGDPDPNKLKEAEEKFKRFGTVLNDHLKGKKWLVGSDVTLADFAVAAPLHYAAMAQMPLEPYQEIKRWYAQVEQLEAWKKSAS
ncbi:MAG: glutathione S-transferase family protein [Deltaproteobacteria bacterium]|nr:glutathione S-transferase family protein [Deltaproteobacteria bacterium]